MSYQGIGLPDRRRGGHLLIIVMLAVIIYLIYRVHGSGSLTSRNNTTINVTPYDTDKNPPEQVDMQAVNNEYADQIKEQFPWMNSEGMNDTIEAGLDQSLLIPTRSALGLQYFKTLPRDRTIHAGGLIMGEKTEGTVALNNAANIGSGSVVPLGQDSQYTIFKMEHGNMM